MFLKCDKSILQGQKSMAMRFLYLLFFVFFYPIRISCLDLLFPQSQELITNSRLSQRNFEKEKAEQFCRHTSQNAKVDRFSASPSEKLQFILWAIK